MSVESAENREQLILLRGYCRIIIKIISVNKESAEKEIRFVDRETGTADLEK
jgi:hypothetical protein